MNIIGTYIYIIFEIDNKGNHFKITENDILKWNHVVYLEQPVYKARLEMVVYPQSMQIVMMGYCKKYQCLVIDILSSIIMQKYKANFYD
ncbi:MAG: hypothetical protein WC679_00280 [Bacteroidales bacterium]|jgi:hypothetical protein